MGASPRRGGKRLSGAYWTRPRLFPSNSIRWASERPRRSSHHTMSTPQRGPRGSVGALIEEVRFARDLYGAFPVKRFFVRSGKAVLHPVACDPVPGARGRGQGTETLAELGGLPP